ncbi:hypothetical protein [Skermanella stibiiresistens]|nr:hypothetical protein [Skermanella stibiiresistens]
MRRDGRWGFRNGWVVAVGALALMAPAIAGFTLGRETPLPVEIAQVPCGVPKHTASFTLPGPLLDITRTDASLGGRQPVPVWLGPFAQQGSADVVRLRFGADAQGDAGTVSRVGDVIHLPVHQGDPADPPRRILLHCRNDVVALVQYVSQSGAVKEFAVIHTQVAEGAAGKSHHAAK